MNNNNPRPIDPDAIPPFVLEHIIDRLAADVLAPDDPRWCSACMDRPAIVGEFCSACLPDDPAWRADQIL